MTAHTTLKRPWLLALACLFAGVTLVTILKDVFFDGASFNLTHLQSVAAMIAAIASGHFVLPALRQKYLAAALGLALVFGAATAYIVVAAGARNAEVAGLKTQAIEKRNAERDAAREELAKAEAATIRAEQAATAAIRAAADECGSGKGGKCRGKEATREAAKDDLTKARDAERLARGKLLLLGPDENPHEGYHHAARTLEAIGIGSTSVTEAKLELLMPFALVLISELATLVFSGLALGHQSGPVQVKPDVSDIEASFEAAKLRTMLSDPIPDKQDARTVAEVIANRRTDGPSKPDKKPDTPKPTRGGPGLTKAQALDDIMQRLADGRTINSQDELAEAWNRPKQTVSDWMREWRKIGVIPQPVQTGRCNVTLAKVTA